MKQVLAILLTAFLLSAYTPSASVYAAQGHADTPALRICTDEAEAVLAILAVYQKGVEPTEADWMTLFATEGYRRLEEREHSVNRPFDQATFKEFVRSPDLAKHAPALRETLALWRSLDFGASTRKVSAYLPEGASIRATVYFVIKPKANSFVFDLARNPAIFFYLDPAVSPAKLENTVAHELHHVGLHDAMSQRGPWTADENSPLGEARSYVGAFGEGFAMLAAAGGPDVHPHAVSPEAERARWEKDVARFAQDLREIDAFLLEVASGRLSSEEARKKAMAAFWGDAQGAWYTVGYRMSILIEKTFGRERLLDCMADLSRLLPTYNEAAIIHNRSSTNALPVWSEVLLKTLQGKSVQPDR